jgi:hypothetical protein
MISHEHPRFSDPEFHPWRGGFGAVSDIEPCAGCGNDTRTEERMSRGVETVYCSACRELCPICGDWIAGRNEMTDNDGKRVHVACEANAILETMP